MKERSTLGQKNLKYDHIIGCGGIGHGIIFSFQEEATLGRNESRLAVLEPAEDYCKLHIILHYMAMLVAAEHDNFKVYPIGMVGDETNGKRLRAEMKEVGMQIDHVGLSRTSQTMFSVCFQYPDFSGGNITSSNSAGNEVTPEKIAAFFEPYDRYEKKGIFLAVPEVPLPARMALLRHGRKHGGLNVSSMLSEEAAEFAAADGYPLTDLLAINIDEAKSIAAADDQATVESIVRRCVEVVTGHNPALAVLITNGAQGSYCYQRGTLEFTPVVKTDVVSTAGAGDALLAGTLAGMVYGLPLTGSGGEASGPTAVELGTLVAAMAVESIHTINKEIDATTLEQYARQHLKDFDNRVTRLET